MKRIVVGLTAHYQLESSNKIHAHTLPFTRFAFLPVYLAIGGDRREV
jgi:hypothetical protein